MKVRRRAVLVAIGAVLAFQIAAAVKVSPNFLAYFNGLAGGPAGGHRHLLDSSLDWGQDLPGLKRWLEVNNPRGPTQSSVYLSYFGNAPPEYFGIDATILPGFPDVLASRRPPALKGGIYCFSANLLQGLYLVETLGPWDASYEKRYQDVLWNLRLWNETALDSAARAKLLKQTGDEFWPRLFHLYERLRVGRLAAFLRTREPDATIGYSILIYRLTNEEIDQALHDPIR